MLEKLDTRRTWPNGLEANRGPSRIRGGSADGRADAGDGRVWKPHPKPTPRKRIWAWWPPTPIIAMTANAMQEMREGAEAGMDEYLLPAKLEELRRSSS